MSDVIIVACGGNGRRWAQSTRGTTLPPDKCRLRVNGEAIMDRSAGGVTDLVGTRSDTVFVTHETGYKVNYPTMPPASATGTDVDKFLSSRTAWSHGGRTIILFGDVFMSDACISTISTDSAGGIRWYGRRNASAITGKRWGEIWGVSVGSDKRQEFEDACYSTAEQFRLGTRARAIGWDVFECLTGLPACAKHESFVDIDDWTEDFDTMEDWTTWNTRAKKSGLINKWSK
jgi:hypothetical protein